MPQEKRNRFFIILMLGLLSAIGPFSIDMYLPAFQVVATDLGTDIAQIQLSLTSFFIGIAFGQLIYGPLLDRYGRKIPLIIGLLIYVGASIGCALTQSADHLIAYRFIQALGSCGGMVASRAMVRDFFPPQETARIFSLLMLVIGVSPILAPTIGGFMMTLSGWHSIFVILGVIASLILLGVIFLLPKGKSPDPTFSLKPIPIVTTFWKVLRNRNFIIYGLAGGIASSGLYAYLSGSSYVMMDIFGLNEQQYGWVFAIVAVALITASQLNNILLRKRKSERIAKIALLFQALFGIALLITTWTGHLTLYNCIFLIFGFLGCQGFVFPNTSALALNPFSKLAGSASALLGSMQLGIGALASALVSIWHDQTALPMAEVMAGCALLSFLILLLAPRKSSKTIGLDSKSQL